MSSPSITTPALLRLHVKPTAERPSVDIRVALDAGRGVYVNSSLALEHPNTAITTTLLGKLRLGELKRDALRSELAKSNEELLKRAPVKAYFKNANGRAVAEKIRLDPTAEQFENLSLIYKLARLVGDYPVQAVGRSFGLIPDDARRWVGLARRGGWL